METYGLSLLSGMKKILISVSSSVGVAACGTSTINSVRMSGSPKKEIDKYLRAGALTSCCCNGGQNLEFGI